MKAIDKMIKYLKGEKKHLASYRRRMERSPIHTWTSKAARSETVACLSHQEMIVYYALEQAKAFKEEEKLK